MDEIRKVNTNDSVKTVTSNSFISAKGLETLSLKARKMLYVAISQCKMTDESFYTYEISVKEFANLMNITPEAIYSEADKLTLPTAKAGGFLFLPPLHWQIPYGTAMSYTVSTGYIYTVPACPAVQFSYLYADCSCSPFFKILMPAFVSRS